MRRWVRTRCRSSISGVNWKYPPGNLIAAEHLGMRLPPVGFCAAARLAEDHHNGLWRVVPDEAAAWLPCTRERELPTARIAVGVWQLQEAVNHGRLSISETFPVDLAGRRYCVGTHVALAGPFGWKRRDCKKQSSEKCRQASGRYPRESEHHSSSTVRNRNPLKTLGLCWRRYSLAP